MKLWNWLGESDYPQTEEETEGLHVISTCTSCDFDGGCDMQDWNNSRADVEPDDPFGCIHWEEK